jgi:hypothetical protein
LLAAGALLGQETAFDRLKREAARIQALASGESAPDMNAAALAPLHLALRDWIESQLPQKAGATPDEFRSLETALQRTLRDARLDGSGTTPSGPHGPGEPRTGYLSLEFKRLPELPDALFVIAGITVECGADEAVYLYHFDADGRTRAIEDHPKSGGFEYAQVELSDPDADGRRLLATHYMSTQCASFWMGMAYSVYQLDLQHGAGEPLLADTPNLWIDNDGPEFVLEPEELVIELLDRSVDAGVHNRTRIYRYSFSQGVQRLDPVALQPQDFAEEWLTRPWSEMQSRSAAETKDWHDRLHGDFLFAHYAGVVRCGAKPGRWLIGLDIDRSGEKDLPDPLRTWFLVRDLGNYRYNMEAVSASRPTGCPGAGLKSGAGNASDQHPWLSREQLKALQ